MKKLHTFSLAEQAQAGLLKELLEKEGVACLIKNEQLFAALGEITFLECRITSYNVCYTKLLRDQQPARQLQDLLFTVRKFFLFPDQVKLTQHFGNIAGVTGLDLVIVLTLAATP